MLYVSQPSDATKYLAPSINYKIKLKQSEFKWYARKILGLERFLWKIRDIEKKLPLKHVFKETFSIKGIVSNDILFTLSP